MRVIGVVIHRRVDFLVNVRLDFRQIDLEAASDEGVAVELLPFLLLRLARSHGLDVLLRAHLKDRLANDDGHILTWSIL